MIPATDWLARGGTFFLMGFAWIASAVGFALYGTRIAKLRRMENDGCLLAISNVILALLGGGVGYFLAGYPWFIVTSIIGTLTFPALATWSFIKKTSP